MKAYRGSRLVDARYAGVYGVVKRMVIEKQARFAEVKDCGAKLEVRSADSELCGRAYL